MKENLIKKLEEKFNKIQVAKDEVYDAREAVDLGEKGDLWILYVLGYKLIELQDFDDNSEEEYLFKLDCLNCAVEYGQRLYKEEPELGCILLGSAYGSFPRMFKKNPITGDWDDDDEAEKQNSIKAAKFYKEAYTRFGDKEAGVVYARRVVVPVYPELDPLDGIRVLKEIIASEDCPAGAYELMAQELMMGKRVQKDVNKSIEYFDKAIAMGDEYAVRMKEHFIKTFMNAKPKKGWFW